MLSADDKPIGKSGQRKRKAGREGKKAEQRRRESAPPQEPQQDQSQQDQLQVAEEAVSVPMQVAAEAVSVPMPVAEEAVSAPMQVAEEVISAPMEVIPEEVSAPTAPTGTSLTVVSYAESSPVVPVTSAETVPVSYQTIANAYCNYSLRSLDRTRSYFERLAAVRSPDKALELQTEFATQAYEGFVTESQKICELQSKLAQQRLKRWEDLIARMITPARSLTHRA
jgi:phasin protein